MRGPVAVASIVVLLAVGSGAAGTGEASWDIYSIALDGTDLRNLTSTAGISEGLLSRSHDGARLAYVREGSIYVSNADGTEARELAPYSPTVDFREPPVWSPKGIALAYAQGFGCGQVVCDRQELWVADVDSGRRMRLATSAVQPSWSPTGRQIVYTRARLIIGREPSYRPTIVVTRVDGRARRTLARGWTPGWSPTGGRIAFFGRHNLGLFTVRLDGRSLRRLTRRFDTVGETLWSPGSRWLAFGGAFQSNFYVVRANGHGLRAVARVVDRYAYSWSPDGRRLAWPSGKRIVIRSPLGGSRQEIAVGRTVDQVVWSADGRRLLFVA
jgi:Tol biopolymer transport system component